MQINSTGSHFSNMLPDSSTQHTKFIIDYGAAHQLKKNSKILKRNLFLNHEGNKKRVVTQTKCIKKQGTRAVCQTNMPTLTSLSYIA